MTTFVYPNGDTIKITDETLIVNNHTWYEHLRHKVYESESIQFVYEQLSKKVTFHGNATLLDIGAQSGLYSLYSKYFKNVRVDAYEPLDKSYKCLVDNIALNDITDRVFPYQIAISNTQTKTILRCPRDHTGLNTLGGNPLRFSQWDDVEVSTNTIDNLYANKRIDFIKCDIEGWEYFMIQGAKNVLLRDKPDLLLEVCFTNMEQCGVTLQSFLEQLRELGYVHKNIINGENWHFSAE
jgi:FkbM family methyltransferase